MPNKTYLRKPGKTMQALVLLEPHRFEIQKVPIPHPGPDEVLCRVMATSICGTDPKVIDGKIPGWPPSYPFIAGHEWSGQIVELGEAVTGWKLGDRVVGEPHKGCGNCRQCLTGNYNMCDNYGQPDTGHRHYGFKSQGSYADYMVVAARALHHLPDSISYVEGTMVGSAGVALHGLRLAGVEPASTGLVIGPGAIGLCAIQLLKAMGATRVICVGRKGARLEMAQSVGADDLVDSLEGKAIEQVLELTEGRGVDISVESAGAEQGPTYAIKMTRFGGKVVLLAFFVPPDRTVPMQDVGYKQLTLYGVKADPNTYTQVLSFVQAGKLALKPLISHVYPLRDFAKALDTFVNRREGAMKVVIEAES
ncbi:MAG TPA: alcohol dehydrogenase catalytic domain-containing protein [Anaerolineae bacterium]|nr:alcohol dehydrogenase catalytic domain-containing protein [Anaerolineae bacterium]